MTKINRFNIILSFFILCVAICAFYFDGYPFISGIVLLGGFIASVWASGYVTDHMNKSEKELGQKICKFVCNF